MMRVGEHDVLWFGVKFLMGCVSLSLSESETSKVSAYTKHVRRDTCFVWETFRIWRHRFYHGNHKQICMTTV